MRTVIVFFAGNERGGAATHIVMLAKTIVRFGRRDQFTFLSCGNGPLYQAVMATGVHCDLISGHALYIVSQLRKRIQLNKRVLVHAHGPRLNILASMAAQQTNTPFTSTIHSNPLFDFLGQPFRSRFYPKVHMWSLKKAIGLFVVQPIFSEVLPSTAILEVPNAVDIPTLHRPRTDYRHELQDKLGLSGEQRFIGISDRFDASKNISVLIRAFAQLKTPNIHLVLAGGGPEKKRLEQCANQLGVQDRVHFLGYLDDMMPFYAAIDVHVLPSSSEGTPFSVLEAGSYGVANVTSDIPSLQSLLADGQAGGLFPLGNAEKLTEVLERILEDDTIRIQYVDAFRQYVLPQHTPARMLEAYNRGYTILEEDILRSRQFSPY